MDYNFRVLSTVLLVFYVMVLIGGRAYSRQPVTLVNEGQSKHTIVIAANSSPPQHYAAQELQTLLEQISGATLPVADQPTESPMILVGPSDGVNRLLPEIEYETLGEEGLIMKTVGPHLVLTGGPLRGTLYAVYEFLDRQLGCRWFTGAGMTPAVTRIPQKRTIVIDSLDVRKVPALEYRSARHRELSDGDWAARNRFNGHSAGVTEKHGGKIQYYRSPAWHTFRYFFGPSHFESHPEYFAQVDGQRQMSQLCTSHPNVIARGSNLLRHWLRQDPKARFVSLIANDSGGFLRTVRSIDRIRTQPCGAGVASGESDSGQSQRGLSSRNRRHACLFTNVPTTPFCPSAGQCDGTICHATGLSGPSA